MKIMIVDDNAEIRKVIAGIVASDDNEVVELEDGEEAVEQYGTIKPDRILTDIKMKCMGGFEAVERIKRDYPNARIVIVTRYDSAAYQRHALPRLEPRPLCPSRI